MSKLKSDKTKGPRRIAMRDSIQLMNENLNTLVKKEVTNLIKNKHPPFLRQLRES